MFIIFLILCLFIFYHYMASTEPFYNYFPNKHFLGPSVARTKTAYYDEFKENKIQEPNTLYYADINSRFIFADTNHNILSSLAFATTKNILVDLKQKMNGSTYLMFDKSVSYLSAP